VRTIALLCLLTIALAGCGGAAPRDSAKSFKGDKAKVAAPVEALEQAARDHKPQTVCSRLLTARLLAQLNAQGTNCTTAVKDAFDDADSVDLTVDAVTVSGNRATARVISGKGSSKKTDTLQLARDGATWKIDLLRA
jgi:hypothetical protein